MAIVHLAPAGIRLDLPENTSLREALFTHGVEFPCGGGATCRACRVRVVAGEAPATDADRHAFTASQMDAGWRLGCRMRARGELVLELARWTSPVLADDSPVVVSPRDGLGIAIDLGTTTLVAQLVGRRDGRVLATRTALNPQARFGADVMTRIDHAHRGGAMALRDLVRSELGRMCGELASGSGGGAVRLVTVVGNTAMHHLFGGIDVAPLSTPPYRSGQDGLLRFAAAELGWGFLGAAAVRVLPCLGGFVGSDLTAGILATRLTELDGLNLLVDLGTNGEIVCGGRDGLVCASTAAGPAFEGAGISIGMRAATGAINACRAGNDGLTVEVLGGVAARGICGSGLVDAVAGALDLGWVLPSGRLAPGRSGLPLAPGLALSGADVRQLQLAKAAISAGIDRLCARRGGTPQRLQRVFLAGAFGNYVRIASAVRIGLLPVDPALAVPTGNTALLGARLALNHDDHDYAAIRTRVEHVELKTAPGFDDAYVEAMGFSGPVDGSRPRNRPGQLPLTMVRPQ